MYLKRLAVINYKSCQGIKIDLLKDSPNTLIGINDAGKSTILKSIGLLLDPKAVFNVSTETRTTSDISNTLISEEAYKKVFESFEIPVFNNTANGAIVIGEFIVEENEITEEFINNASPQLKWAIESLGNNRIIILKQFENNNATGKYFLCLNESNPALALWNKKDKELQTLRKENAVSDQEIQNDNSKGRFANFELIRALYNKIGAKLDWAENPSFAKDDIKLLPTYRYIDWNTSLTDIENLANDVMKSKIEKSKVELIAQAVALSQTATEEVNKEFEVLTRELTKDLKTINGIKAKINFSVSEKISDLIINKTTTDGDIRLESQGEGVKRQILFSFLKWASKRGSEYSEKIKNFIWCFDEPEAHLYPTAQRELYKIISDLALSDYQIFLGTHSTIFVDRLHLNEINKVKLDSKYSEVLKCSSIDDLHDSLGVRNSDILFFDKFLAIEGESEEVLIPHFYKLYHGKSLEEDSIKLIALGGIGQYAANKTILENILKDFKKTDSIVYCIFDKDTNEIGSNIYLLGTCDLEDLLPNDLWIRLVKDECGVILTVDDFTAIRAMLNPATASTKFHKLLSDRIASDSTRTHYLPSKPRCAEVFQTYITKKEELPLEIQDIFSKFTV